jgi:hypothetical protein
MRLPCGTLLILALAVAVNPSAAANYNMIELSRTLGEATTQVAVEGTIAYAAANSQLAVVDVSNPASPILRASVPLPATALGVAVSSGIVYVANGQAGVKIFDVSNPDAPALLSSIPVSNALRVYWNFGRLYICRGNDGLSTFDVTDPAAPLLVSNYDPPLYFIEDIEVSFFTAYLGVAYLGLPEGYSEVLIVDVLSNPPQLLGTFRPNVAGNSAKVGLGLYLYISGTNGNTNFITDVSNPAQPAIIKNYHSDVHALDITYSNGYMYSFSSSGLRIYDVSPAASASLVQSLSFASGARGTLVGNRIYQAFGQQGFRIMSIDNPASAVFLGGWNGWSHASRLTKNGNFVYASGDRLAVIDVDDPSYPEVLNQVDVSGYRTVIAGNHMYMAAGTRGLVTMDITNPELPAVVSEMSTGDVVDLRIEAGSLYVLERGGLRAYDLANPSVPSPRGFQPLAGAENLAVSGHHAYVTQPAVLTILDISDPDMIGLSGTETAALKEIEAVNGKLYAAAGHAGLRVYDLGDPADPELLGTYDFAGPSLGLDVVGSRVYVANQYYGVAILDASDPSAMVEIGSYGGNGLGSNDVVSDGNLVFSGTTGGMVTYELTGVSGVEGGRSRVSLEARAVPNPFHSTTTLRVRSENGGSAKIMIYAANGRIVRGWTLTDVAGTFDLSWNGTDSGGQKLPSGVYFIKVVASGSTATQRVTLIH